MSYLVCGRCTHRTAENSAYCTTCRWTLYSTAAESEGFAHGVLSLEEPAQHKNSCLARRRLELRRSNLERALHSIVNPRLEKLEKEAKKATASFEAQRAMGLLTLLEGHSERAEAHFQRARELYPHDLEVETNYGVVLAERAQVQPALQVLQAAQQQWPGTPLILLNLALVALQARRPQIVLQAIDELEQLWFEDPSIIVDYHDEAVTVRGLALLELGRLSEASASFEAAARHIVSGHGADHDAADDVDEEGEELADAEVLPSQEITLEGKPSDADFLNNLALAEIALGRAEQAAQRLQAAARIEPANGRVLNNLGVLAYRQGKMEQAWHFLDLAYYVEMAGGRPDPAIFNHLGVALSALGRPEEALAQFRNAGGYEHADFDIHYNLGRAYFEHGKPELGIESLQHAYAIDPNQPDLHAVLGAAYLLRGKPGLLPKVFEHLKRALQLDPKHRTAFADLVAASLAMDNEDAAHRVIHQALKTAGNNPPILFLLAVMTMEHGTERHLVQALEQFGAALAGFPNWPACIYNAGLCHYLMGFKESAAKHWQKAVEIDGAFAPAYFMLGMAYADAKRFSESMAAWQKASQHEPHNVDLQANMGCIHYRRGDYGKASACYTLANHLTPLESDFLDGLGLSFARAGRLPQAIAAFEQSLFLKPRAPMTHSNLGLAYYLNGRVEHAIDQWRLVSQIDPGYASRRSEEQQRSFDDSSLSLRPLNWRARVVKLAPILPRPRTRLLPGYNSRAYRLMIGDDKLRQADQIRRELARTNRTLAWLSVRHEGKHR